MYYRTRSQFTATDVEFIAQTLGETPGKQEAIRKLTEDPSSMTQLLHERELFERSTNTPPLFLTISPQLFFYVFVYRALDHKKIANDDVVDYIAGICVEFRSNNALWQMGKDEGSKCFYVVDLLNTLSDLAPPQQYVLRRYIANVTLFLSGFFPDYLFTRTETIGAPPISYFEKVGRTQYETAAEESLTYDESASAVLMSLAEQFVEVRSAINIYTDAYLHLHSTRDPLLRIRRQMQTLDNDTFRQSLSL